MFTCPARSVQKSAFMNTSIIFTFTLAAVCNLVSGLRDYGFTEWAALCGESALPLAVVLCGWGGVIDARFILKGPRVRFYKIVPGGLDWLYMDWCEF